MTDTCIVHECITACDEAVGSHSYSSLGRYNDGGSRAFEIAEDQMLICSTCQRGFRLEDIDPPVKPCRGNKFCRPICRTNFLERNGISESETDGNQSPVHSGIDFGLPFDHVGAYDE